MEKIIEVTGVKKSYGPVQAVKGIDFYVEQGTLFAFLGPNGAGKTTTIDILCTLLKPDAGQVKIAGHQLGAEDDSIRAAIGVVFQKGVLDMRLTVRENLLIRGRFYGLGGSRLRAAVKDALRAAGAEDFADRPYGKLSGGQRRRSDIARALVNTPRVLFLDEPTTGLDPQARRSVWDTVKDLQRKTGMTVMLTTHYMEEAAAADYVTIINEGLIAAKGTPLALKEQYSHDELQIHPLDEERLTALLGERGIAHTRAGKMFRIPLKKTADAIPLIGACHDNIERFQVLTGTMEDAFINIIGKEITEP